MNKHTQHFYCSPLVAALWSAICPGFGQLYNRDYLYAILFIVGELVINSMSNLNSSIYYTFQGDFVRAYKVLNFQWAMFYPSLYPFSMWQAYNRAQNINSMLQRQGFPVPSKTAYHSGLFLGMAVGFQIGLQLSNGGGPIVGTLVGALVGALIGAFIEQWIRRGNKDD